MAREWGGEQVEVLARGRESSDAEFFSRELQEWIDEKYLAPLFDEGLAPRCESDDGFFGPCGAEVHTLYFQHDPGGPHEFIAVRLCARGHRTVEPLRDTHQAAVDATVRRTLTLELPLQHCPIRACADECGGELLAHGYVASLQGTPGFWVYLTCSRGCAPYWGRLFGEAKGAAA